MSAQRSLNSRSVMASRWRRRTMCVLIADAPAPAAMRNVSATSAFLETNARPGIGAVVELQHPEAGTISGKVYAVAEDGIGIRFQRCERSVAFALAAIAADMSRPA